MEFTERQEVIVWLSHSRLSKRLRKFGTIIYVSFQMNYVIMYLDKAQLTTKMKHLEELSFVTSVEISPRLELETNFEGKMGSLAISKQQNLSDDH
ncbi:YlbG family protein [Bombilactobacillus thymidiniphilus]|uniref:YlbG family protein n=1 Tax=Bombilactobacillus thymidiniphilus TaxID=2923363 RepID=A0ABY4PDW8_9LACO|nr:YlbG family protein [Bombilactobacillus thymidiniphilus]UQS83760.1 YlbG family protein [Bombilactobacillus thymidiniphilus]